jgi:hypothetical protein
MGEFARARTVADALCARWPQVQAHFLVHRGAPYAASLQHPATLIDASPTLCTRAVLAAIERLRPAVVYFDNSGRTRQLRAAHAAGARLIYVSSRSRQRRKAFRPRWMRALDEHWISYPASITGPLTGLERLKLRLLARPEVHFLDAVLPPADNAAADALLEGLGAPDLVVVPGGGSHFADQGLTPAHFAVWAAGLAAAGNRVVFVAGPSFDAAMPEDANLRVLRGVGGGALMSLLGRAKVVLVNGGDTLLQALALGRACVTLPIAGDQAVRIARCATQGVVVAPSPADAQQACAALLGDDSRRAGLQARVRAVGFEDALPGLVSRIGRHLGLA